MGDFRVKSVSRVYCLLLCMVFKAVISSGLGKCPVYPALPEFDLQRITGTWYEVERSFYMVEMTASCVKLDVTVNERSHLLITVHNVNRWTGSSSTTHGIGIPSYNGSSSFRYKLNNRVPYVIGRMLPGAGQYHILFTDYEQFVIVWSCSSYTVAHSDHIWVLGRSREIEASVRAHIYAIMEELSLDPDRLMISKNSNCNHTLTHIAIQ